MHCMKYGRSTTEGTQKEMSNYGAMCGLPVRIISKKDDGDQVRTHKKKRINKKWRKHYGTVSTPIEKGQCVIVKGYGILMSLKTYQKLKRTISMAEG